MNCTYPSFDPIGSYLRDYVNAMGNLFQFIIASYCNQKVITNF